MKKLKKIFGGVNLSWKNVIIFAIIAGVYTSIIALLPQAKHTSFYTINVTMEVWILFGIFIIMNSKSNKDSALKCFVFFLISQPLVYLIQVLFSSQDWSLFKYYIYWFKWTVLCLPMGFIGYYIKKDKWWGYLILLPMIGILGISYNQYLSYFTFYYPYYFLISLFCAVTMIMYPIILFNNKIAKIGGAIIDAIIVLVISIMVFTHPYVYTAEILSVVEGNDITSEYEAHLEDSKYGNASVIYLEDADLYMVQANFKRPGKTKLIVKTPEGKIIKYDLSFEIDTYNIEEEK